MRLLLDTHVLIWWLHDNPKLGSRPRALIADAATNVFFSAASCWEASIKFSTGKMELGGVELWRMAVDQGLAAINLDPGHFAALEQLPLRTGHGDPFDRLLLAQAKAGDFFLMTADRQMTGYGIRCVGVR
jgi:PIN domain nuclease of toxin-antitoxin system